MANSHMTFGVDLLPKTTNTYALGNSNQKWKIYGDFAPLDTKTYTNVIATSNNNQGGGFFYLKVRGDTYNSKWYVKTRVFATVPGQELYETDTIFELWGYANTYCGYACMNKIKSTSYRPIYYNSYFRVSQTGYNNDCGGWIGFNLYYATNNTDASYKRTVVVELLDYDNCTVELQDSLITPDNIPNRASNTRWYSSTNTSFDNFNAYDQGLKQSGDANTTSISNLYHYNGNYIADSALYQCQLLFHTTEDRLTPLNNNNNVTKTTKTMLVNTEFLPFEEIFYYGATTTVAADGAIGASVLYYSHSGIDLRYSFNITTSDFTAHKNVYLVLTPTADRKAKIADATPLTQTLPATDDGFWYLLLGRAYNGYCISLYPTHPIYAYKNGKIIIVEPPDTYIPNVYADTFNGLTIASSVPANADFTDTKNTAGATNTSSKIFLIGATAQDANPQTYSHDTAYVGTDGCLYSGGAKVLTAHQTYTQFTGKPTGNQTPAFGGTFTIQQISQSTTGQVSGTDRTVTIPATIATNTAVGLVKPWYTHTAASTGPTTGTNATAITVNAITTTSGKYYAVEADSNGRLFVNVPWSDSTGTTYTFANGVNGFTVTPSGGTAQTVTVTPSMTILSYGHSTWQDFLTAYNNNSIVYCRASSNSNPASGSQTRMAFMAYVNNETSPKEVEFQYYRSASSHSFSVLNDEVYVYKFNNAGKWTVTIRKASVSQIKAGTNISISYGGSSDNSVTVNNTQTVPTASSTTPAALGTAAVGTSNDYARADHVHAKPTPADIGAAPLASPALTGTPTAPTAAAGTSTTQIATTEFVTTLINSKQKLLSFSITTSNWTSSAGLYVYTISDSFVTENTAAIVNMNNSYDFLLSNLQVITGSGTVTFSTGTIPSNTISGVLVLLK